MKLGLGARCQKNCEGQIPRHSRAGGNPEDQRKSLDPRLRGDDRLGRAFIRSVG